MKLSSETPRTKVMIVGAGITGLLLAQALKRHGVPLRIFERDTSADQRGKGWGLSIFWALDTLLALLPQHIVDRLDEAYVNPDAVANGETGSFLFYDLQTGEPKWQVPAGRRIRVARERLRRLLMDGLEIEWDKTLVSFESDDASVTARFSDGSVVSAATLVGCDGSRSRLRQILCPGSHTNSALPVRFLGVSPVYPADTVEAMRRLDPYFLQAGDPATDCFFWFSFLDTPANNDRTCRDTFTCQIMIGWPYRSGFLGREPIDIPTSQPERLALMKRLARGWASPFCDVVGSLPADAPIKAVALEDWVPEHGAWDNCNGTVTLVGDAAHAMTMFRGDAANQGIRDVAVLLEHYLPVWTAAHEARTACDAYEREMILRTRPAVLLSRRACMDAHDYKSIDADSPLVSKRSATRD